MPYVPGGTTDIIARIMAQRLSERMKQTIIVDNRPGAGNNIGTEIAVKSAPDGYTLFMTTNTTHSANPSLVANLKYDPIRDFTPIARVGELPFALVVNQNDPAKTLREWIDNIKRNPFNDLFTVLSNNKNYTSLKAAQDAELKRRMLTAKEEQDDR